MRAPSPVLLAGWLDITPLRGGGEAAEAAMEGIGSGDGGSGGGGSGRGGGGSAGN
jgi:hypothetical protein